MGTGGRRVGEEAIDALLPSIPSLPAVVDIQPDQFTGVSEEMAEREACTKLGAKGSVNASWAPALNTQNVYLTLH